MLRVRRLGAMAAVLAFALDQAVKAWALSPLGLAERAPIDVLPILDLRLAWNTGISYSLFHSEGDFGRYALGLLSLAASLLLGLWLWRARRHLTGAALGLIMGGALANALDRFLRGAVVDFIHVHLGTFSPWGVFNLADTAIVAGVGLLLYDAFSSREAGSNESVPDGGR